MHHTELLMLMTMTIVAAVSAEMFTAIVDLEEAVRAENRVAQALRTFADREQTRINTLRRLADNYEEHSQSALVNAERHLSNPVNAFLAVKRFTSDWDNVVQNYIRNDNASTELLASLDDDTTMFPTNEDLTGVTDALLRLQDTYALPTDRITTGDLHAGMEDTATMSANDCYEVGRQAYLKSDFYHTVLWMREALRLLDKGVEDADPVHLRYNILDHLSYASFMRGDADGALRMTEELLKLDPLNGRFLNNRDHYKRAIEAGHQSVDPTVYIEDDAYRSSSDFVNYERLCRGEETHHHDESKLTCQYRRHRPMFFIKPLREEVLYLSPRFVVYHNAVSNSEIKRIREMATPRLDRATVQNAQTGKLETASYRVSKSAWLKDYEDAIVRRISDRAKAIANLTGDTVEELQVVNYGIGGHYEPHFDHARKSETNSFDVEIGNRIATFICYISDVEAGGATVFNVVGARVLPEKGSCAIWYNLHRNGDGNVNTRHAACPVLVGSKWVMNKWFHERGEEFIRPCSLSENE